MKTKLTFLFFLAGLFAASAFGQGVMAPPQTAFKTVNGVTMPIAGATITVCAANATGVPCSPALSGTVFKDSALTQPLSNPFTADASGNYQFAAAPGQYTVTVTASGFSGYSSQLSLVSSFTGGNVANATTFLGPITVNGTANLNGGGNVAIKPPPSDAVLYLSQNGNDLNDCKSWGSACLTVAHVESLLPTATINSTQVPYGTVWVGANPSGYPIGANITVNSPLVHYKSVDGFNTVFSCTASTCFTQNFSAIVGAPLEAWPNMPFLQGITLQGNGSANQVGIAVTDGDGFGLAYDAFQGFTGSGAQAVSVTNSLHESERMWFMRNWFIGNTKNVVLNGVASHASFGHDHFIDNDFDLAAGTAAFTMTGGASLYDGFITSAINAPNGSPGTYYVFSMDGSGTIVDQNTFVQLSGDVGGGTLVGVQFLTGSPIFQPAGKLSDVGTLSTGTGTLASTLPTIGQHTGPGAAFQGAYAFSTLGLLSSGGGTITHQAPNTASNFTQTDTPLAGSTVVNITGSVSIASGFGTTPSIVNQGAGSGPTSIEVNVGTGGVATSGVLTLPAAPVGWSCHVSDMSTNIVTRETAFTTTSVTLTAASAWAASDKLLLTCWPF